jgi:uncharacterized membrane protein
VIVSKPQNRAARVIMGTAFLGAGVTHFTSPRFFEAIIPEELPRKRELVYGTGVAELVGGAALLMRPSRTLGWFLIALLAFVFPANINQAVRRPTIGDGRQPPRWALIARLPLQAVMVWLVLAATRPRPT